MAVEVLKLTYLWQDNDAKQLLILLFYTILFIFCFAHARVQYFFYFSHLSVILFISLTFFFAVYFCLSTFVVLLGLLAAFLCAFELECDICTHFSPLLSVIEVQQSNNCNENVQRQVSIFACHSSCDFTPLLLFNLSHFHCCWLLFQAHWTLI